MKPLGRVPAWLKAEGGSMTGAELRASGGGDQGVVTFRGELDAANAAAAADAVLAAAAGGGA